MTGLTIQRTSSLQRNLLKTGPFWRRSLYQLVVSFVKYRGVYVVALFFIVSKICTFSLVTFSFVDGLTSYTV